MKYQIKSLMLASIFVVALSCGKKDEVKPAAVVPEVPVPVPVSNAPRPDAAPLTKAQSTNLVSTNASTVSTSLTEVQSSTSVKAMTSLQTTNGSAAFNPIARISVTPGSSIIAEIILSLHISSLKLGAKSGRIDGPLSDNKGAYKYNPSTDVYDKTAESDMVVIEFPDSLNKTKGVNGTNNCKLTISNYEFTAVGAKKDSMPTKVNMELLVNGTKEMAIDFTSAYDANGDASAMTGSILINPFKLSETIATDNATFTNTTFLFENVKTASKIYGYDLKIKGSNLIKGGDADFAEGYVFFADLAIEGSINSKALTEATEKLTPGADLSEAVINENVKLKFKQYSTGNILGTLTFKASTNDYLVVYQDKTTATVQEFLKPFIDDLGKTGLPGFDQGSTSPVVVNQ